MSNYQAIITMKNGDIVHYGVVGMKWGQHKYAKANGGSSQGYVYKSFGQKHAQKKYNKAMAKDISKGLTQESDRTARKRRVLDYKRQRDAEMQEYGKNDSIGKAIARNALLGGEYAKQRAHSKVAGASETRSRAHAIGATLAARYLPFGLAAAAGVRASSVLKRSGYDNKERRQYAQQNQTSRYGKKR